MANHNIKFRGGPLDKFEFDFVGEFCEPDSLTVTVPSLDDDDVCFEHTYAYQGRHGTSIEWLYHHYSHKPVQEDIDEANANNEALQRGSRMKRE